MALYNNKKENEEVQETVVAAVQPETEVTSAPRGNEMEVAYITKGTKITGDIISEGNVVMDGEIEGVINADGSVIIHGATKGDIIADSVLTDNGKVNSNVTARENIIVKADSAVVGDIDCQNITVYGTVKGNINATGTVFLKSTAVVTGKIEAAGIGMEVGATVAVSVESK